MYEKLDIKDFLNKNREITVVDVRSPIEYNQGHIPGSINLPLFSDEERKQVGTVYKKSGFNSSLLLGLKITGPKLDSFVKKAKEIALNKELLIHCWRGGKRSESMAWLFDLSGIKTSVLIDGYKAYRTYLRKEFEKPANIIVLGGMTGSGKTDILIEIIKQKHQVLNLEGLANHKGSAFGSIGQEDQPTTEQFENNIYEQWLDLDFSKPIWIEDESKAIGKVHIPDPLYKKIREARLIKIEKAKELRVKRLVKEYTVCDKIMLENAIVKISKRLGGLRTKECLIALKEDNFNKVADISLEYYDKAYNYGLSNRKKNSIINVILENNNVKRNTNQILNYYEKS